MNTNTDPIFSKALDVLMNREEHVFLTGNAGTGKTTLINTFQKQSSKNLAIVAPTGVAAVNVGGETIHSFFGFPPNVNTERAIHDAKKSKKTKIFLALEVLVIDEISMVRADLLDCIDIFLQTIRKMRVSFGGVRVIMVGDLHQLPPVVTLEDKASILGLYSSPYFFSSHVFQKLNSGLYSQLVFLELEKIYRQKDPKFVGILNRVRTKSTSNEDLETLNRCLIDSESIDDYILLTTINFTADKVNEVRLSQIDGPLHTFHATVTGLFSEKQSPAAQSLTLKTGAKVMLLNNDPSGRWINGTIGVLYRVTKEEVFVKLENGEVESIEPVTWNTYKTRFNEEQNKIESFEVGSFKQFPLRLAWAITIHKSQGKTFQKVAIDFGSGSFAHGQTYVALSRATTLNGLKLLRPLSENSIIVDEIVLKFLENIKKQQL